MRWKASGDGCSEEGSNEGEFRGFGEATVVTVGDANRPPSLSRTVFWRGERPEGSDPDDNPYEALKGADA